MSSIEKDAEKAEVVQNVQHLENPTIKLFSKSDNAEFYAEALDKYGFDGAVDKEVQKKLIRKVDYLVIPW